MKVTLNGLCPDAHSQYEYVLTRAKARRGGYSYMSAGAQATGMFFFDEASHFNGELQAAPATTGSVLVFGTGGNLTWANSTENFTTGALNYNTAAND